MAGGDAHHVLQLGEGLRQRLREGHAAAAGVGVDERRRLGREEIAEVGQPLLRKDDDQIAVGVAASEVVKLDAIVAIEQRQAVGDDLVRQELRVCAAEDLHLLHPRLRVGVGDDRRRGGEVDVAADVIGVGMRVDDCHHALVADRLDVVADRPSPAGRLGVDEHNPLVTHQRQRVAAAGEHVEDVADVERLHPDDLVALRALVVLGMDRDG